MPDDILRLAVLIDADNASAAVIGDILAEVSKLGTASVKRVYGDFTTFERTKITLPIEAKAQRCVEDGVGMEREL
jgi:hypothetical protein